MNKFTLIKIFTIAATVFAVVSLVFLDFSVNLSRNSTDPDLVQFYWEISGFAALLLFVVSVFSAIAIQLLRELEA